MPSYLTQRFDNGRTGWNPSEKKLTVHKVKSGGFGVKHIFTVTGEVFAQPLYLKDFRIGGRRRDIVFVVTSENWIYAFDTGTFATIWKRSLTPQGCYPYMSNWAYYGLGYNDYYTPGGRTVGIIGTPVIDPVKKVAYLIATCQTVAYPYPLTPPGGIGNAPTPPAPGTVQHWLHAIDLKTGHDRRPPRQIGATVGAIQFDSRVQMQRPGLLLSNGKLHIGFGSYGDNTNIAQYYGWLLIYKAATLTQVGAFLPCPDATQDPWSGKGGSIWMCGTGIAADARGNLYFATGNGEFETSGAPPHPIDYGDSVVQLRRNWTSGKPASYFTPWNEEVLDKFDLDQGVGGVLVVPHSIGRRRVVVQIGKSGRVYVLKQGNLGGYKQGPGPGRKFDKVIDNQIQIGPPTTTTSGTENFYGCPTYYKNSSGKHCVFFGGNDKPIQCRTFHHNAKLSIAALTQTADTFPYYGTIPAVSSKGSSHGTGIVWAIYNPNTNNGAINGNQLKLRAYAAENLSNRLFDGPCGTWPMQGSFLVPTVVDGKVFVGSDGQVYMFGL